MQIKLLHPKATEAMAGPYLPAWLSADESAKAADVFNHWYVFGGWQPFQGFTLSPTGSDALLYPGDPPLLPLLEFIRKDNPERVIFYPHSWVAAIQPDRSFEVCRLD